MKLIINGTVDYHNISKYKKTLKHYNLEGPVKSTDYDFNYYTIDVASVEDLYKLSHELNKELIITDDLVAPDRKTMDALEIYDGWRE